MKGPKVLTFLIILSTLIQPLGLIAPVLAETVEMEYTDPNHLHAPRKVSVCSSAIDCASEDYEYDANGNLVSDGERVIFWNQDNMPIRIEKDGQVVEFFYDASGRRILKRSGEDKTIYVSGAYQLSTINNQQSSSKYYFANGRTAQSVNDNLTFFHRDHIGSTILATDSNSQKLTDPLSYFPYGSSITNAYSLLPNAYLFTGQEKDPEIDLYNYKARLYNPETGLFVSADPVQGPNRYAYVKGNPLRFTDPTGLRSPEEGVAERLWEILPEDDLDVIGEILQKPSPEPSPFDLIIEATSIIGGQGVGTGNWEAIEEALVAAGVDPRVLWALKDSVFQTRPGVLQCVGLVRAYTMSVGALFPRLGSGPHGVGVALEGFEWYGSEEVQEGLYEVKVGDILFYRRTTETNHWAVITEITPAGAVLVEAVGSEFNRVGIYAPAGGIMVNERVVDLSTGEVTGMLPGEIIGWGVYRINQ